MRLLTYTIGGQKIGIDIKTWDDSMLSGNTAFIAFPDTGGLPANYVDISSVDYWDQFGVTKEWLEWVKVNPIEYFWINNNIAMPRLIIDKMKNIS